MENITTQNTVSSPSALALPKGGGAIQGMGQVLAPGGCFGGAELSLPLPISAGRGYTPALSLNYASGNGNGLFGMGVSLAQMCITRLTKDGTPQYNSDDTFVSPNGEKLVAERDTNGQIKTDTYEYYGEHKLSAKYRVTHYFPQVEGEFQRIEHWRQESNTEDAGFWLIHGANGDLHCLGKDPSARLADPDNPEHVAQWWLQESLSPFGHQICYRYRQDCQTMALDRVYYGNRAPESQLDAWNTSPVKLKEEHWLFILLFDYGERSSDITQVVPYEATPVNAPVRQDTLVFYEYGFARKINLLCHQILMFHNFSELNAKPTLVSRMVLEYHQSPELSQLVGVRSIGYNAQGVAQALPPLDFRYTPFSADFKAENWQPFETLTEIRDGQDYQLLDLYGEGIPGLLYHTPAGWYYRAPERGNSSDKIIYGAPQLLPLSPSLRGNEMTLMDLTGDGKLDWIVQQPGLAGYFTLNEDKSWSNFIPFAAWPSEFMAPQAQLVDLLGAGLQDLALIGPKSVRLYINKREAFGPPETVIQEHDVTLPIAGRNMNELVAFSDVLGSGQQHLISVRHDSVTCWPNLGRGRFGSPIKLAGLTLEKSTFNPDQVYLADIDGNGAVDIIYAQSDKLLIFRNQSGNRFAPAITLPLPPGVRYDRLCQLSCADIQGIGLTSIVLTVPYMAVRHWQYTFASTKPYLLAGLNSNMGADTQLEYRSSAQAWLDEKKEHPEAHCHLPFPIQLLYRVQTLDEISTNRLTQCYRYQRARYDGIEREFRGFGLVEVLDTDKDARPTGSHNSHSAPTLTRSWYHTGAEDDEKIPSLVSSLWQPYRLKNSRFTRWDNEAKVDQLIEHPENALKQYFYRALSGHLLRQEVYGHDGSAVDDTPYQVIFYRYQLRQIQPAYGADEPVILPQQIETLSYYYERIAGDPLISQSVQLQFDAFGFPLHSVDIAYPRRDISQLKPYPDSLPEGAFAATFDEQQQVVWLSEQKMSWHHLCKPDAWRLGLPDCTRQNKLQYGPQDVLPEGLSLEALLHADGLLAEKRSRIFAGQSRCDYGTTASSPCALLQYTETAEFDQLSLKAFDGVLEGDERTQKLQEAGYLEVNKVLGPSSEAQSKVWVARRGFTIWHDLSKFYLPAATRTTLLTGKTELTWDPYYCALVATKDAAGHETKAHYDYHFMTPWRLIDINDNTSEVALDGLGRVVASSFYGTEEGKEVGFKPVSGFEQPHGDIAQHIDNINKHQIVASYVLTNVYSWMGQLDLAPLSEQERNMLLTQHWVTAEGYIRSHARHALATQSASVPVSAAVAARIKEIVQIPTYGAVFTADNYPDRAQQIRVNVTYYDGFSRVLQTAQRHEPGEAYQRKTDGTLEISSPTVLAIAHTETRWAVSGRVEYNNKGLPVRVYQPFFVNNWRYVADNTLRDNGYADCHFYDPLGRETDVVTAKDYLRRQRYYPWFTVSEDENDTYAEYQEQKEKELADG